MAEDRPQLYLITPPILDLDSFPDLLAEALDAVPVACVRLALAGRDEDLIGRAADALREVAHDRDVALVIERHVLLAARHGLDGVHLTDGARSVRAARKELGDDAIIGSFCGASRHDGITASEAGADYVAFGPVGGALGDGSLAPDDLFAWWSEVIEVPVVAEGSLDEDSLVRLSRLTDFFGLGDELWRAPDPVARLRQLNACF